MPQNASSLKEPRVTWKDWAVSLATVPLILTTFLGGGLIAAVVGAVLFASIIIAALVLLSVLIVPAIVAAQLNLGPILAVIAGTMVILTTIWFVHAWSSMGPKS